MGLIPSPDSITSPRFIYWSRFPTHYLPTPLLHSLFLISPPFTKSLPGRFTALQFGIRGSGLPAKAPILEEVSDGKITYKSCPLFIATLVWGARRNTRIPTSQVQTCPVHALGLVSTCPRISVGQKYIGQGEDGLTPKVNTDRHTRGG